MTEKNEEKHSTQFIIMKILQRQAITWFWSFKIKTVLPSISTVLSILS